MSINSYDAIRILGEGSFGKVYLMRDKKKRTFVCLKVIKIKNISKKEKESIQLEVKILKELKHPNIVRYIDSFSSSNGESFCICMEYCDGGDLSAQIKNAQNRLFSESKILHWFVQLALGLHYMHGQKVLHRDLKTQNIFLLGNGRLVLGDLGISKVLDGTLDFASTCIGTPYYMSPEIFKNKPYSYKSDVWALGCVLYEMATLNHAFDANSLNGLASKIVRGKYPPINAKYSKNLRDLIAQMLQINASQRPDVEQILRMPFIRKHVVNFFIDIVTRPTQSIGEGTMIFRAAAVGGGAADSIMNDSNMISLREQLKQLDMMDLVQQALAPKSQPKNDEEAIRLAREQASALKREQEKKKFLEDALLKLQKEKNMIRNPSSRIPPTNSRRSLAPTPSNNNLQGVPSRSNLTPSNSNANNARPGWNRQPSNANLYNMQQKRQSEERERLEREKAAREAAEAERAERERRLKENQHRIMEQEAQRRREEISRARELEKEKLRQAELERLKNLEKEKNMEKELEREKFRNASEQARARRDYNRAREAEKQRLEIEQLKQDKLILDRRQMEKDKKREERRMSELSRIQIDRQQNMEIVQEKLDLMNEQIAKLEISPSASRLNHGEEAYSYNRYQRGEREKQVASEGPSRAPNMYNKHDSSDSGSDDDNIFDGNAEHNIEEEEEDLKNREDQLREELNMTTRRVEELKNTLSKAKAYLPKDVPLNHKKKFQEDSRNNQKKVDDDDYDDDDDDEYDEDYDDFESDDEKDQSNNNLDATFRKVEPQQQLAYDNYQSGNGKLSDRIKSLRNKCIEGLGMLTFNEAYNFLVNYENDEAPDLKRKYLLRILGDEKIDYFDVLEQLIFMERTF